jgi:hypothetical protein
MVRRFEAVSSRRRNLQPAHLAAVALVVRKRQGPLERLHAEFALCRSDLELAGDDHAVLVDVAEPQPDLCLDFALVGDRRVVDEGAALGVGR